MWNSSRTFNNISTHMTIEEAKELGLTQIVKQLEIDAKTREGLGMQSLQRDITDPIKRKAGRPTKKLHTIAKNKLIRTNFNNLT